MTFLPKFRTGAWRGALSLPTIFVMELLLAAVFWGDPGALPSKQAPATDDCIPTITCRENHTVSLYPVNPNELDNEAIAIIRAADVVLQASSDCSDSIHYSIYQANLITSGQITPQAGDPDSLIMNCGNCGRYFFRVYVWDSNYNPESLQPDGTIGGPNYSHCEVFILVNDVFAVCNCDISNISGIIRTEEGTPVNGVHVHFDSSFDLDEITRYTGSFFFVYAGPPAIVTPHLDTLPLNGVSTIDVILINRHILGIQPLTSPYKRIAADVNRDNEITIADVLWLRRLILGKDSTFTNNTSWRFVPANYQFPVPTNPWFDVFPEVFNLTQYGSFLYNTSFIGIKIGDVNGTASTGLLGLEMPPGQRDTFPERVVWPYLKEAPEYGAVIGTAPDICEPEIQCLQGLTFEQEPNEPGSGDDVIAILQGADLVADAASMCSDALNFSVYRSDDIVSGLVIPSPNQDSVILNCGQDCLGTVVLRVYVWDDNFNPDAVQPDGTIGGPNYAFCETYVLLTGLQFCECGSSPFTLSGFIKTEAGEGVNQVAVDLSGTASQTTFTDSSGYYAFHNLQPGSYALAPELNVLPKNGVTTLDVLLISKHLLGMQPLDSPYKMIAADVNNDKKLTTIDLIHLRKLILGIDAAFVANTSWRFVPANYTFPVPGNPWFQVFPETPGLDSLYEDTQYDFVAIKIGDVNSSAATAMLSPGTEKPGQQGTFPERVVWPYLHEAPEYGSLIPAVTDTCAPVVMCVSSSVVGLYPLPPFTDADGDGDIDQAAGVLRANDLVTSVESSCSDAFHYTLYRVDDITTGENIPEPTDPDSLFVTCDDCGLTHIRVYVWDDQFNPETIQPNGSVGGPNYSYCELSITLTDQFSICCESNEFHIIGQIETEDTEGLSNVSLNLTGGVFPRQTLSNASGNYAFSGLPYNQSSWIVTAQLDATPLNGVTTQDIVFISRYILGIQPLGSPYKIIAADVNKNKKITTADLIHLRRLILGLDTAFVNNTSWRFVRASYEFPVPSNPWFEDFPESITIPGGFINNAHYDFVAIKVGDVNTSAATTMLSPETEKPGQQGTFPERVVWPYRKEAPEYGSAVGTVTDTCAPVVECINGLAVELLPLEPLEDADGDGDLDIAALALSAAAFIGSANSPCGSPLHYSIHKLVDLELGGAIPNPQQDTLVLTCDDFGPILIRIYVWDDQFNPEAVQPDGSIGGPNFSHCDTYVLVQDNFAGNCSTEYGIWINGRMETTEGEWVSGVQVHLTGNLNNSGQTGISGTYNFSFLPLSFSNTYTITPELDLFPANGVTTFDVALVRRHIQGVQIFTDPYKMIAADVNNDKKITTLDAIYMRRLILGIETEFPGNTSWRFVPSTYVFPHPLNPWFEDFPEASTVTGSFSYTFNLGFVAIKIGDVNSSAATSMLSPKMENPGRRSAFPERVVWPYLHEAPEYGSLIPAVTDTCAPVVECINGLAIELLPLDPPADINGDGSIDVAASTVFASDFVDASASACSDSLRFSIHKLSQVLSGEDLPHPEQASLPVTCDDLGTVLVRIYVWDDNFNPDAIQPDGTVGGPNYSYCETYILVQDNLFDLCSHIDAGIGGQIRTEEGKGMRGVRVQLINSANDTLSTFYTGVGAFNFGYQVLTTLSSYTITPYLDSIAVNGISAWDHIFIRRHILNIQGLPSPYKRIAADLNGDHKITTLDLIQMQRLILDLDHTLPNNTSWRFIPSDYTFPDPINPWAEVFPESKTITYSSPGLGIGIEFIAIKIGDVNGSAVTGN